ncbi:MAG: hypothetical protein K2Q09_10895, partial [Phycisphaerales bacterium]|nr:hypothetical protein [Phycisphaerales bacterium]
DRRRQLRGVRAMKQNCETPSGKKFTDSTLPIGTDFVEYSITPVRSGLSGTATTVMVRFGSVGGEQTATLVETNGEGGVKLAA